MTGTQRPPPERPRRIPAATVILPFSRGVTSALAALLLIVSAVAGCGAAPSTSPAGAASDPAGPLASTTVPLTFDTAANEIPGVDVEVGGVRLHVKVDTGSSGLRVDATKVPAAAVRLLGVARPYSYASGARSTGDLAEGTIGIGGARSTTPTRFELIRHVDCLPDHPGCPLPTGRFDGIIGLSPHAAPDLDNPLWSLGPVGHAYTVRLDPQGGGTLVLGAPAEGFVVERLAPTRARGASAGRAPDWQDTSPICVETAAFAGPMCAPTVFDTGDGALADVHLPDVAGRRVPAGVPITLRTPDGGWTAVATTATGRSAAVDDHGSQPAGGIVGRPVFQVVDVRFDLAAGTIGFRTR